MKGQGWGSIVVMGLVAASPPAAASARAPHADTPIGSAPAEESGQAIRWLVLRVEGGDWAKARDELAPRLPGVEILPFDEASFARIGGELFVYVEVRIEPEPAADVELTLVLSDRRAYSRRLAPERSRPLRSIATTVANMLVAIEQEALHADQLADVPRPTIEAEPEPTVPEPTVPAPAPTVAEPEPTVPEPEPTVLAPAPAKPRPAPAAPAPRLALGLTLGGQTTFGLAPSTVRGLAALGGETRISARHRRGLVVELGLRMGGRGREAHRLWRSRLQLAVGYTWSSGPFGLTATAGPTVEPWTVRQDGTTTTPTPLGDARATPLWGAAAAVSPGLDHPLSPSVTLRLALRAELATSVLGSGAAARVLLEPGSMRGGGAAQPLPVLFTLGGLETSLGIELTLWIGRRPATRHAATASHSRRAATTSAGRSSTT